MWLLPIRKRANVEVLPDFSARRGLSIIDRAFRILRPPSRAPLFRKGNAPSRGKSTRFAGAETD
jgi:hypothetical protein